LTAPEEGYQVIWECAQFGLQGAQGGIGLVQTVDNLHVEILLLLLLLLINGLTLRHLSVHRSTGPNSDDAQVASCLLTDRIPELKKDRDRGTHRVKSRGGRSPNITCRFHTLRARGWNWQASRTCL